MFRHGHLEWHDMLVQSAAGNQVLYNYGGLSYSYIISSGMSHARIWRFVAILADCVTLRLERFGLHDLIGDVARLILEVRSHFG